MKEPIIQIGQEIIVQDSVLKELNLKDTLIVFDDITRQYESALTLILLKQLATYLPVLIIERG